VKLDIMLAEWDLPLAGVSKSLTEQKIVKGAQVWDFGSLRF
jgi:hypothetical protein